MTDASILVRIINDVRPDEIYNLAAQSHVRISFDVPEYTANADGIGALRLLEAVRFLGLNETTPGKNIGQANISGSAMQLNGAPKAAGQATQRLADFRAQSKTTDSDRSRSSSRLWYLRCTPPIGACQSQREKTRSNNASEFFIPQPSEPMKSAKVKLGRLEN